MSGPVSFFTSKLATFTEYSLSPAAEDSTIKYGLKTATIAVVNGLDYAVQLIETIVSYIFGKVKELINSEGFQTVKNFTLEKATIAKDFVVDVSSRFYSKISELQRPSQA